MLLNIPHRLLDIFLTSYQIITYIASALLTRTISSESTQGGSFPQCFLVLKCTFTGGNISKLRVIVKNCCEIFCWYLNFPNFWFISSSDTSIDNQRNVYQESNTEYSKRVQETRTGRVYQTGLCLLLWPFQIRSSLLMWMYVLCWM